MSKSGNGIKNKRNRKLNIEINARFSGRKNLFNKPSTTFLGKMVLQKKNTDIVETVVRPTIFYSRQIHGYQRKEKITNQRNGFEISAKNIQQKQRRLNKVYQLNLQMTLITKMYRRSAIEMVRSCLSNVEWPINKKRCSKR